MPRRRKQCDACFGDSVAQASCAVLPAIFGPLARIQIVVNENAVEGWNASRQYSLSSEVNHPADAWPTTITTPTDGLETMRRSSIGDPNQLRHTRGTELRQAYGIEAAQVSLGHTHANITEIYAERNFKQAIEIAKRLG